VGGYGADVLDMEPPPSDHPILHAKNTVITPHIGSRTYESVQRQAGMAAENLILALKGEKPLAQANDVPIINIAEIFTPFARIMNQNEENFILCPRAYP